jgi:cytoskeletal protein CcmA (bactofilin family)
MFRRRDEEPTPRREAPARVDSVLGAGLAWKGDLSGRGGLRIDGAFDGDIEVHGLVVIGTEGRVSCKDIRAVTVIVSGSIRGNITAERVEILSTGRVWGDVVTASFSTEEGAFMRGQITMEEDLDLGFEPERAGQDAPEEPAEASPSDAEEG